MTFSKFTEFKHHNLFLEHFHHPQNNKLICSQDLLFFKNVTFKCVFGCFTALRILFPQPGMESVPPTVEGQNLNYQINKKSLKISSYPHPLATTNLLSVSMDVSFLDISYNCNHTICTDLLYYNVFQVYPCCSAHSYFVP